MANEHRLESDQDVEEILRLAVRHPGENSAADLRQRLQQTASELGISPADLARAEKRYFEGKSVKDELKEYDEERRRGARMHLISYIAVNLGLLGINIATELGSKSFELWSLFPLMGWGIGLMIHLGSVYFVKPSITDDEFQEWRRKRHRALDPRRRYDDDDDDD